MISTIYELQFTILSMDTDVIERSESINQQFIYTYAFHNMFIRLLDKTYVQRSNESLFFLQLLKCRNSFLES